MLLEKYAKQPEIAHLASTNQVSPKGMDWWNLHIQSPGRRDGHLLGTP
jgi:hypothetical protein